jgi:hypothetical protein
MIAQTQWFAYMRKDGVRNPEIYKITDRTYLAILKMLPVHYHWHGILQTMKNMQANRLNY